MEKKMKSRTFVMKVLVLLVFGLFFSARAEAAYVFASPAGGGDCTTALKACTLDEALASPSVDPSDGIDTVTLTAGTYSRDTTVAINEALILSGEDLATTIITPTATINTITVNDATIANTTIIENLTINVYGQGSAMGIYLIAGSPTIQNNIIRGLTPSSSGYGIYFSGSSNFAKIDHNKIIGSLYGIYTGYVSGTACSATDETNCLVIKNNIITKSGYYPLQVYTGSYIHIYNNILTGNYGYHQINLSGANNYILNNTVYGNIVSANGYYGIYNYASSGSNVIQNNIVAENGPGSSIYCYSGTGDQVLNNLIYGNTVDAVSTAYCDSYSAANQYFKPPDFFVPSNSYATVASASDNQDGTYTITMNETGIWSTDEWVNASYSYFLVAERDGVRSSQYPYKNTYLIKSNGTNTVTVYNYDSNDIAIYLPANTNIYITSLHLSYRSQAVDNGANIDSLVDLDALLVLDAYQKPEDARTENIANDAANSITIGDSTYDIDIGALEYSDAVPLADNTVHGGAYSSTLYAASAGSTTADCKSVNNACTVQRAIDKADDRDGTVDTINLAAGTYTKNLTIKKFVVLTSSDVSTAIFQPSYGDTVSVLSGIGNSTVLSNMTIMGRASGSASAIYLYGTGSPTIQSNIIRGSSSSGYGIQFSGSSNSAKIDHNKIIRFYYGIYTGYASGTACTATDETNCLVIKNNIITKVYYYPLQVYTGSYIHIYNNILTGNLNYHQINVSGANNYILNNTVYGNIVSANGYYGIYNYASSGSNVIQNNIVAENGPGYSIYCYSGTGDQVLNNLIYGNTVDAVGTTYCDSYSAANQYFKPPDFFVPSNSYATVASTSDNQDGTYTITMNETGIWSTDEWVNASYSYFLVAERDGVRSSQYPYKNTYLIKSNGTNTVTVYNYDSNDIAIYLPANTNIYITSLHLSYRSQAVDNGANIDSLVDLDALLVLDAYQKPEDARTENIANDAANSITIGDSTYDIDIGALEYSDAVPLADNTGHGGAYSSTLYAASAGSTTADCKSVNNACTVQRAIDKADDRDGTVDQITVLNGTYTKNLTIKKTVELLGQSLDAIFQPSYGDTVSVLSGIRNDTLLFDMTIMGRASNGASAIYLYGTGSPTIQGNIIRGVAPTTSGNGIYFGGASNSAKIDGNKIIGFLYGVNTNYVSGTACTATDETNCLVIKNNIITKVYYYPLYVYTGSYIHIYNNILTGNYNYHQINISGANNYILNNTIYGNIINANGYYAIYNYASSGSSVMQNNIIAENDTGSSILCYYGAGDQVLKNLIYGNAVDAVNPYYACDSYSAGNQVFLDPSILEETDSSATVKAVSDNAESGACDTNADGICRVTFNQDLGWGDNQWVDGVYTYFLIPEADGTSQSYNHVNSYIITANDQTGGTSGDYYADVYITSGSDLSNYFNANRNVHITRFMLNANSPAIDAGNSGTDSLIDLDALWTADIWGGARLAGSAIDIGVYEMPKVTFSTASSSAAESAGTATATLTLSGALQDNVTVPYTVTGTATSGTDYAALSGTATITAGQVQTTIDISITNDTMDENDETVILTMGTPTNAAAGTITEHTLTITDDDDPPAVTFASASSSGDEGTTSVNLGVSLGAASGKTVTVDYAVSGGTATGSGTDYTLTNGTLTFSAGEVAKNVAVTVVNDTLDEENETIIVAISNPSNATLGATTSHTYTITDDDAAPTVAFSAASSSGAESTTPGNLAVALSAASGKTVTVYYAVSGGTATGSGTDYTLTNGTLTFSAGDTSKNVAITVVNDSLDEDNETVIVAISNPSNATLGATTEHTYTINDDDDPPTVAFSAASSSGAESATPGNLAVALSAASGKTVTVDYAVSGGTATGSGTDYTLTSGTLTFNAGDTSKNVAITVVNDSTDEDNETVIVGLSNPSNVTLGATIEHTYTINDDDVAPTISIDDISVDEGNAGGVTAKFTISLSAASGKTVTVDYATANNTAISGSDYTSDSGTLTFNAGVATQDLSLTAAGDTTDEDNETFNVDLSNPSNATITDAQGVCTITDDDTAPTASFTTSTQSAAEGATATATVQLSAASGKTITVPFTVSGTATNSSDYSVATSSPLTIAAGSTSSTISVPVTSDSAVEDDETIILTLGSPTNATAGTTTAHTITITGGLSVAFANAPLCTGTDALTCTVTENSALTFDVVATGASAPTMTLSGVSGATLTVSGTTGSFSWTPVTGNAGSYTATIVVSASSRTSVTKTASITVESDETTPSVTASAAKGTYRHGETVTIAAVGSDGGDGDPLTYVWSQGAGTAITLTDGAELGSNTGSSISFVMNLAHLPESRSRELYSFTVRASDGDNLSDPATVNLYGIIDHDVADTESDTGEYEAVDGDVIAYGHITSTTELNEIVLHIPDEGNSSIDVRIESTEEVVATYTVPNGQSIDSLEVSNVFSLAGENASYDDVSIGISSDNRNSGIVIVFFGGATLAGGDLDVDTLTDSIVAVEGTNRSGDRDVKAYLGKLVGSGLIGIEEGGTLVPDDNRDIVVVAPGFGNAYGLYGGEYADNVFSMTEFDFTIEGSGDTMASAAEMEIVDVTGDDLGDFAYITTDGSVYLNTAPYYSGYIDYDLISFDIAASDSVYKGVGVSSYGVALEHGDFNGDGISDLAVGNGNLNQVMIYLGAADFDTSLTTPDVTIAGVDEGDMFGARLAAGDVDGDGILDLIIAAPGDDGADNAVGNAGAFYILYGSTGLGGSISASDLYVTYNSTADEEGGIRLYSYDLNGDGVNEVIYGTVVGKTIVAYLSALATAEDEMLVTLGENNPTSQELVSTVNNNVVMMQLKVANILDEDALFDSITITGGGTANDAADIAAVRLYVDVNEDGLLDANDYQVGEEKVFTEDDGSITFDGLGVTITSGDAIYLLVVYDIELSLSYAGHGLSIVPSGGENNLIWIALLPLLTPFILSLSKDRRRKRVVMTRILGIILGVFLATGIYSCGSGAGDTSTENDVTFSVGIASNGNVGVESSVSQSVVDIAGAPVTSNTITVK